MKIFIVLLAITCAPFTYGEKAAKEKITLKEALENAYRTNQFLGQVEYELKSSHESLSAAKREWFPQASISTKGSVGFSYESKTDARFPVNDRKNHSQTNSANAQVQITQNLFNGGATYAQIKATQRNADGSQAKYRSAESSLFLNTVKAYSDYVKKLAIYKLRKATQAVLEESLSVVQSQYDLGEKTISDVATTQAKLEESKARITLAKADLEVSISNFEKVVGFAPNENLENPISFKDIPTSKKDAQEVALKQSYEIHLADAAADTAREQTKIARKDMLPSLDLQATGSRALQGNWHKQYPGHFSKTQANSAEAAATLTIPLDFRGSVQARVRGQKYAAAQKRMEALYKRREVLDSVTNAWEKYQAALAQIKQYKSQVKASKIAFESTTEEYNVGSKTTLELLEAEAKYSEAQINLVAARQDYVQNSYELAHAVGLLNPAALNLTVDEFIPNKHKESRPVWGLGIGKDRRGYDLDAKG